MTKLCGGNCFREAGHEDGCFAPITPPSETAPHPDDCYCEWCDERLDVEEWTYTIEHNLAMYNVVGTDKKIRARIIASCYEREDAERIMALYVKGDKNG